MKLFKRNKNSKGYISIEVVAVAGILLVFGVACLLKYQFTAEETTDRTYENIDEAFNNPSYLIDEETK